MSTDIQTLLSQMTQEEKADLCSGRDFWFTQSVDRLGIPALMLSDGPHGLRKQASGSDHIGINQSVAATCFPTAVAVASSWNTELIEQMGEALGKEAAAEGVAVLLGPGVNIKRSPLCGRNFEYLSEDPYVSGQMATHYVQGIQSQGVGACLKHFAVNNQECRRMTVDAQVDEQALREIYLPAFEQVVKQARPWMVMSAYNRVNGVYASENARLLTDILRKEWGFNGVVVSDWGAVNERVAALQAGLDLEMPGSQGVGKAKILAALRDGTLSEECLDRAVSRLLELALKANTARSTPVDFDAHHELAREVAAEGIVMLKNQNEMLPLRPEASVAVIGAFARAPRYQGGGSSRVKAHKVDDAWSAMQAYNHPGPLAFAPGYHPNGDADPQLLAEACELAASVEQCVLFVGLPESFESEGFDRTHLSLPESNQELIRAVAKVNPNIVVVLCNGAPVEMPWLSDCRAVLETYLGGQAIGRAVADILYGTVNPSGKLTETFPQRLAHSSAHLSFPGENEQVVYREGIFVGYRYAEKKDIPPLFPFGFGLSYTRFDYSDLELSRSELSGNESLEVRFRLSNVGPYKGKEICQLYVRPVESLAARPVKELKGFTKVELMPGESMQLCLRLDGRAFAGFDTTVNDWRVVSDAFDILVGGSSVDTPLVARVHVTGSTKPKPDIHRNTRLGSLIAHPETRLVLQDALSAVRENSALMQVEQGSADAAMLEAMRNDLPLRGLVNFFPGQFGEDDLQNLIQQLQQS